MEDAAKWAGAGGRPASRGAEWIHYLLGSDRASLAHLEAGTHPNTPAAVYVNHGRWVVDCPTCNGAQLACRTDHRFLCNECGNVEIQGLWRTVVWPADVEAIEGALQGRPLANQNWIPGQTVEDLQAETLVHSREF